MICRDLHKELLLLAETKGWTIRSNSVGRSGGLMCFSKPCFVIKVPGSKEYNYEMKTRGIAFTVESRFEQQIITVESLLAFAGVCTDIKGWFPGIMDMPVCPLKTSDLFLAHLTRDMSVDFFIK